MEKIKDIISFLKSVDAPNRVVLVGLGNPDRADDGFGIELADRFKGRFPNQIFSEHERSVEGIVMNLIDRDDVHTVLFIDATDFGGKPGDVQVFSEKDAQRFIPSFSTHKVPITLLMELIRQHGKTSFLLGVQPESLEFLGGVSRVVIQVLDRFENDFIEFFTSKY